MSWEGAGKGCSSVDVFSVVIRCVEFFASFFWMCDRQFPEKGGMELFITSFSVATDFLTKIPLSGGHCFTETDAPRRRVPPFCVDCRILCLFFALL